MKFLRAEEGDDEAPAPIRPVMQIVPPPTPATNGHKRSPAHAAQSSVAPALAAPEHAAPAHTATEYAATAHTAPAHAAPPQTAPAQAARPPASDPTPAHAAPAHAAPAHVAPQHAAPALSPPAQAAALALPAVAAGAPTPVIASPKHARARERRLREVGSGLPAAPRIRPELSDACVVALRRMGGAKLQSVGVTSSVRGEGRSTVAAALAVIHASEYRRKTILVELDGHKSPATREFGLAEGPGVAEFVRDNLDIEDCIQWIDDDLGVVVAGAEPSMAKLQRGSTAEDLVAALSEHAETLVLDLPPLEKGAGGVQLVDLCESVALVVRAGVSTHRIEEAAATLTTPPFVILNGVKSAAPRWVRRLLGMR